MTFTIFAKKFDMPDFNLLRIKNIIKETSKAVSIEFEVPSLLKNIYSFVAGQYVTIKATIDGKEVRRAYSICAAPKSDILKVAIKEVENGLFSTYATTNLQIGDELAVHTPEGNFILEPSDKDSKTYGAFAAGSGITPIMSMIKAVLQQDSQNKFVLVYGNKSPEETIFFKEINTLKETYNNRFHVEYVYSRSQQEDAQFGRIEKPIINYVLKNKYKEFNFDSFYLCGPETMINLVTDVLTEHGIIKDNIHFELFTSSSNETEIEENLEGSTNITILVDDEEFTFSMDQKENILNAALAQDIDAPYSCQGGVCSSCICRITEGKAVMTQNNILTDSELEEGLVLACQAHPTTATITVDFDDA